jgi:hypothetical protein
MRVSGANQEGLLEEDAQEVGCCRFRGQMKIWPAHLLKSAPHRGQARAQRSVPTHSRALSMPGGFG